MNRIAGQVLKQVSKSNVRHPVITTLLAVACCIGFVAFFSLVSKAVPGPLLTQMENSAAHIGISPNPNSFFLYNNPPSGSPVWWNGSLFTAPSGVSSNHGFKHLLKNETSSNVRQIELKAYYRTQAEAQSATFTVRRDTCAFSTQNSGGGADTDGNAGNNFPAGGPELHSVNFTINGVNRFPTRAPITSPNYGYPATNGTSNDGTVCGLFNNRTYGASGSTPTFDAGTGMWVNNLVFTLYGNRYSGGGNQVRFQVQASGTGVIGLKGGVESTNFGIAENFGQENQSVAAVVPFGKSCTQSSSFDGDILIYDPDNGYGVGTGFGPAYVFVEKRASVNDPWIRLTAGEYNDSRKQLAEWVGNKYELRSSSTGQTSRISIARFEKDMDYLFVFDNPESGSFPKNPSGNVLSFSLPGDTINAQFGCNYNLRPTVTVSPLSYAAGESLTVTGGVTNTDNSNGVTGDHNWQMYVAKFSSNPSRAIADTSNALDPCSIVTAVNRLSCGVYGSNHVYPAETSTSSSYATANSDTIGTYTCFFTRVANPTQDPADDTYWAYTDLECSAAGAKPRIQVWGHDVKVIKSINTSTQPNAGETRGSWGEYGVLSNLINTNMASGSGLLDGQAGAQANWSTLTFANLPQFGNYGGLSQPIVTEEATESHANLSRGGVTYGANEEAIILVADVLRITDDLVYDDDGPSGTGYTSITQIPRIIYRANQVIIEDDVRRIDPWIVANDITTCDDAQVAGDNFSTDLEGYDLHSGMCNQPLRFNGPVIADRIYLMRTTAPSATEDNPAETFNLRADAFLSSFVGGGDDTPVARTDNIYELPPRF